MPWKTIFFTVGIWAMTGMINADPIVLEAKKADGHDNVWKSRGSNGESSWGIRGSHEVESGKMWFDSFPGESGKYNIKLGAILESDGRPKYEVFVDGKSVGSGKYPFAGGDKCNSSDNEIKFIDLGDHKVNSGDIIEMWGESTYECDPSHGAYTRWFELRFEKLESSSNDPILESLNSPEKDQSGFWKTEAIHFFSKHGFLSINGKRTGN